MACGCYQAAGFIQLVQKPFDPLTLEEARGGLQNVSRMRRVVVGVGDVIVALNHCQPVVQYLLVTAERLLHVKVQQEIHP